MCSSMEDLLDAHARLRVAARARQAGFIPSPEAEEATRERITPVHREGTVHAAKHTGRVAAVFAWRHDPSPWYGAPVSSVLIDYELDVPHIDRWLAEVLDEELPRMEADLDLLVDASYVEALRALRARGVGVNSLQLAGDPKRALARLVARSDPPRDLSPWGVTLEPLTPERLDESLALHRETFAAHPEHCWFGANDAHLARMRRLSTEDLDRPEHLQRALIGDGRLLGHLSASVRPDPSFGRVAGMSLVLAPSLRGRGILRSLYRLLLEGMVARGAQSFRGGTSQPAVIRIGAEMGRPLHAYVMRRRTFFPDAHFAPYPLPT